MDISNKAKIKSIHGREVFDARGMPNVEVDVLLEDGSSGRVIAPGGSSRGSREAVDVRDADTSYFGGMGVSKAVKNVNIEIAGALVGLNAYEQAQVDKLLVKLDGTPDKHRLGGNAIIATSIAVAKAAAQSKNLELYQYFGDGCEIPISLVIMMFGGPVHVGGDNVADFQEYALYDLTAKGYKDGFIRTLDIYKPLRDYIAKKQGFGIPRSAQMAGWLPARFDSNDEALAVLTKLVNDAGYIPGKDFGLYLDIAASHLYKDGRYYLKADSMSFSTDEWVDSLVKMMDEYPIIVSLEDCLFEEDWEGWKKLTSKIGHRVQIVGDDFFATSPVRLKKGIESGCANAIVIKPNQVGTLTEALETVGIAKSAGYATIISVRSGQVFDPYVAHLCVGQNMGQCKMVEAPAGVLHLNEVLRIEESLGNNAVYQGSDVLSKLSSYRYNDIKSVVKHGDK
ncbi:phosphopyruvate hydratase [Chloroflexota bacterium]